MSISLLRVPSSAGAYGVGQERAPEALEAAGPVGVVAGLATRMPDLALAYLDTPETTRSGILDAMGIAHLLGLDGVSPLAGIGPRAPARRRPHRTDRLRRGRSRSA